MARVFNTRPLLFCALCIGFGILAASRLESTLTYILCIASALCALAAFFFRWPAAAAMLVGLSIGMLRMAAGMPVLPVPAGERACSGFICETPEYEDGQWRLTVQSVTYDGDPVDGRAVVYLKDSDRQNAPQYGQTLSARAALHLYGTAPDYRTQNLTHGVSCYLTVADGTAAFSQGPLSFVQTCYGALLDLRAYIKETLLSLFGENGGLAAGMLLGDKSNLSSDTLDAFRSAGMLHLLAVSGLHISILAGFLSALLRRCNIRVRFVCIAVFLFFLCALCAFSASAVRAAFMTLCLLGARLSGRRYDAPTALGLSFGVILLVNPFALFSVGLQLSFLAVAGIVLISPILRTRLKALPRPLGNNLSLLIGAQLGVQPISCAYFHSFPLLSLLVNLLVIPIASLALVPILLCVPFYALIPAAGGAIASFGNVTLTLIRAVTQFAAAGDVTIVSSFPFAACVFFYAALLFLSRYCLLPRKHRLILGSTAAALSLIIFFVPFA